MFGCIECVVILIEDHLTATIGSTPEVVVRDEPFRSRFLQELHERKPNAGQATRGRYDLVIEYDVDPESGVVRGASLQGKDLDVRPLLSEHAVQLIVAEARARSAFPHGWQ